MQADFAIIGGTGLYDPKLISSTKKESIETRWGSVEVIAGEIQGNKVAFLPRHGFSHSAPPHLINYRANIAALKKLGVTHILASAAVGSLRREISPGSLVIVDQFIDFTKQRSYSFFEGDEGVLHVDMTNPYCGRVRKNIENAASLLSYDVISSGTYVCTEGPRFETPAEIRMFAIWQGDVVGMTSVPEVILAKEQEICYASVAMVTNYGAGMSDSALTHQEVIDNMAMNVERIRSLFYKTIELLASGTRTCGCPTATSELGTL